MNLCPVFCMPPNFEEVEGGGEGHVTFAFYVHLFIYPSVPSNADILPISYMDRS